MTPDKDALEKTIDDTNEFSGSYTNDEGQRIQMTTDEAAALWRQCQDEKARRETDMPDEHSAIQALFRAYQRLEELGWRPASYCPKDGSMFQVIEAGSTGIFDCRYRGEWPNGTWDLFDSGDIWSGRPILFKLLPEAQSACDAKRAEMMAHFAVLSKSLVTGDDPRKKTLIGVSAKQSFRPPNADAREKSDG